MPSKQLHEPWRSFLHELDDQLTGPTELHCFGGFVIAEHYGLTRATADIDILESKGTDVATLAHLAGKGSPLHQKHHVYIDIVTIAEFPDEYDTRLEDVGSGQFQHLRLRAFERHDLILAKLSRNIDRDREDVEALTRGPGLDIQVLKTRYTTELRPKIGRPDREDLTLDLWTEMIQEINASKRA